MSYTTSPAPLAAPPLNDRRRRPHRLLQFDLLVRIAILFSATITLLLAWFVPQSLTAHLLVDGGSIGQIVLMLMTAAVLVGYADAGINDLMSDRYAIAIIKRNRHLGYSLIATLYLLQAYVSVGRTFGAEDLLPMGYTLNAFLSAWYSWTTAVRGWHV